MTLEIGLAKQLFVTDTAVEGTDGLKRALHQASKHPLNPLLPADKPWERSNWIYGDVIHDEGSGLFRMWYQTHSGPPEGSLIAYATSTDGIHWEKPNLGVFEWRGCKDNNIVWGTNYGDANAPSIIYRPDEPDSQRRYRMYFWDVADPQGGKDGASRRWRDWPLCGGWLAYSPDGLRWQEPYHQPVIPGTSYPKAGPDEDEGGGIWDFLPTVWDEQKQRYMSFVKLMPPVRGIRRRGIGFSLSDDGVNWSEPRLIIVPDEEDDTWARGQGAERVEFYGHCGFPYEGTYLGFLWRFAVKETIHDFRGADDGPIDVQLTFSQDSQDWQRIWTRQPIIPLGGEGTFDGGMIVTANRPLIVGDEIWIYYGGWDWTHGHVVPRSAAIGLAKWRRDGFVSYRAASQEGALSTKPLVAVGRRLAVNADASRGSLKVEAVGADGEALPDFSREDCDALMEDKVQHVVGWKGSQDLSALADKEVRLRFLLRNADLYAFQFLE